MGQELDFQHSPRVEKEGLDKNVAVHFPWIDLIFGIYYLPDEWPEFSWTESKFRPAFFSTAEIVRDGDFSTTIALEENQRPRSH